LKEATNNRGQGALETVNEWTLVQKVCKGKKTLNASRLGSKKRQANITLDKRHFSSKERAWGRHAKEKIHGAGIRGSSFKGKEMGRVLKKKSKGTKMKRE